MTPEQLQQSHKYFLHFVGKGLYSREDFVVECERHGANRAFPSFILKKMKFGDKILLAQYTADRNTETKLALKQGKAEVFGYYAIHGLNLDAWQNEEFRNRLVSQLHVVATNTGGGTINRKCGSYTIGVSYTIKDELKDVIEKIEQLEKEMGIKVKIFVAGSFHHFPLKEIYPVKFSRTGFYIELDRKLETEIKDKFVGFIGDYEQRKYFLKSERESPAQSAGLVLEGASSRVRFATNQTDGRRG